MSRDDSSVQVDTAEAGLAEPSPAIITLEYYDAEGRLVDSEEFQVSPDSGSVWIKPSERILSWPAVRTVRASLARTPATPVDIEVHLLPAVCAHNSADGAVGRAERLS